jgi:hypothetical protein
MEHNFSIMEVKSIDLIYDCELARRLIMRISKHKFLGGLTLAALWSIIPYASAFAGTPASPQSPARPFNLPIISQVQKAKSDTDSTNFYNNYMPTLLKIVKDNLSEGVAIQNVSAFKLDADKLFIRQQANKPIRVYFVTEDAGYHNSLGFAFTPAGSETPGTPYLVFPDVSKGSKRTTSEPLVQGDFVEIGKGGNGYQLDFFLISNGANGGTSYLWNDMEKNSDHLQHVVAYYVPNTSFILIGYEDILGGGDRDYNDCLFVVDVGYENIQADYPN